jgi:hypothetical protein
MLQTMKFGGYLGDISSTSGKNFKFWVIILSGDIAYGR